MSYLITGCSGPAGSSLIKQLLASGNTKLVLATSKASKLSEYASNSRVAVEEGPLADPVFVEGMLAKQSVHCIPLSMLRAYT